MFWIFLILFLLIVISAVIYYFFSVAFVKLNIGNPDDLNDSINKPLQKYKDITVESIDPATFATYNCQDLLNYIK